MTNSSCPVTSPAVAPGSQGGHIHCPPIPQSALHRNSPSPVPSRTPTPHHTPPGLVSQQQQPPAPQQATIASAPAAVSQIPPSGPQSQTMHPSQRQTPTPPQAQLTPQVQPPVSVTPSAEQQLPQQPLSQQSTTASVPTPTATLQPQHPTTPVRKLFYYFSKLQLRTKIFWSVHFMRELNLNCSRCWNLPFLLHNGVLVEFNITKNNCHHLKLWKKWDASIVDKYKLIVILLYGISFVQVESDAGANIIYKDKKKQKINLIKSCGFSPYYWLYCFSFLF